MENEILNLLLETLKIQAEKYKVIVNDDSLTHDQRKEFDTEITQMYNVLANLSNSSTVYTLGELKALKAQYDVKFAEFDEKVKNLDLSHLLVSFDSLTQEQKDSLKGQNGLSAYEIAVNEGFEGTQSEWLESLKGSGAGEGGGGLSLPIEIQDVNELGVNLIEIFQTLGQLSGGTISGININELNGELQIFKSQVSGQYNSLNSQLTSILTRLETLENGSSTPAIMEKTLTYKQSEEGYNILTNFVPNEGETGFLVMNLSADGSETGSFSLGFTFDSSLPFYQSFNIVYDGAFEADTFTFNIDVLRSKDNNLILFTQLLSVGGEPTISDITLSLKIETEQNHSSLDFINVSDSSAFVQENWI